MVCGEKALRPMQQKTILSRDGSQTSEFTWVLSGFSLSFRVPWEVKRIDIQIYKWKNWSYGGSYGGLCKSLMASQVLWLIMELLLSSLGCFCMYMCLQVCLCVFTFPHVCLCVCMCFTCTHISLFLCVPGWHSHVCAYIHVCILCSQTHADILFRMGFVLCQRELDTTWLVEMERDF